MKTLFKISTFALAFLIFTGCSTFPNQSLVGKQFPDVQGTSLDGKSWNMPKDFRGEPTLLLLGYKHKSQFDIDRWLIGLDMKKATIPTYELPTISGMFPQMFSTLIDGGMRKGIPKPLWKGVITVYKDGELLQRFTGNDRPRGSRVILLDKNAKIVYFHDYGFSVEELNKVLQIYESLEK